MPLSSGRLLLRVIHILLWMLFQSSLVHAQVLERISANADRLKIDERLELSIDFESAEKNWCGLYIDWGDGSEPQDVRVGKAPDTRSPLSKHKRYKVNGVYTIRVYPGYVSKLLNSAPSCKGNEQTIIVNVGVNTTSPQAADMDQAKAVKDKGGRQELAEREQQGPEGNRLHNFVNERPARDKKIIKEGQRPIELQEGKAHAEQRYQEEKTEVGLESPGQANHDVDMAKTASSDESKRSKDSDLDDQETLQLYAKDLRERIRSSISFDATRVTNNPEVVYEVVQSANGRVLSVTKKSSSGVAGWDIAVERAIWGSSPLPKKVDGSVEEHLTIAFRPKATGVNLESDVSDRELAYREAEAQERERKENESRSTTSINSEEYERRRLEAAERIRQEQLAQLRESLASSKGDSRSGVDKDRSLRVNSLGLISADMQAGFYVQHIASPSIGNVLVFKRSRSALQNASIYVLTRSPGSTTLNFILASGPFESMEEAQTFMRTEGLPRDMWLREASKLRPLLLSDSEWNSVSPKIRSELHARAKEARHSSQVSGSSESVRAPTSTAPGENEQLSANTSSNQIKDIKVNDLTKRLDKAVSIGDFDFNLSLNIDPSWIDESRYGVDRDNNEALLGLLTGIPNPIEEIYKVKIPLHYFSGEIGLGSAERDSLSVGIEVRVVDFKRMAQIAASKGGSGASREANALRSRLKKVYGGQIDRRSQASMASKLLRELLPTDGEVWNEYLGEQTSGKWFSAVARGQSGQMLGPMIANVHLFSIATLLFDGALVLNCSVTHMDGPLAPTKVKQHKIRSLRSLAEKTCLRVSKAFVITEDR
jgi:hypothetical protein